MLSVNQSPASLSFIDKLSQQQDHKGLLFNKLV